MSYTFADSLQAASSQAVSKLVWYIPLLRVQWRTPDDGQRNCPKHVEFHSKNKFEKLVHLVGFIIRMLEWLISSNPVALETNHTAVTKTWLNWHSKLLCTVSKKRTINSQIITLLLHVSTPTRHPQVVRSQYLAMLHQYVKCSRW